LAIKDFQTQNGISGDGRPWDATISKLLSAVQEKKAFKAPDSQNASPVASPLPKPKNPDTPKEVVKTSAPVTIEDLPIPPVLKEEKNTAVQNENNYKEADTEEDKIEPNNKKDGYLNSGEQEVYQQKGEEDGSKWNLDPYNLNSFLYTTPSTNLQISQLKPKTVKDDGDLKTSDSKDDVSLKPVTEQKKENLQNLNHRDQVSSTIELPEITPEQKNTMQEIVDKLHPIINASDYPFERHPQNLQMQVLPIGNVEFIVPPDGGISIFVDGIAVVQKGNDFVMGDKKDLPAKMNSEEMVRFVLKNSEPFRSNI